MDKEEKIIFPDRYKVVGADLSLRRPGFSMISVDKTTGKIEVEKIISVNNKTSHKKTHGELLEDIRYVFAKSFFPEGNVFYVRETEVMHMKVPSERSLSKVVGLMDWLLWDIGQQEWHSIYPVTIKKLITGSGKAQKEEVAEGLEKYVGKLNYRCDDESDAVAVAIAWLIQQGEIEEKV